MRRDKFIDVGKIIGRTYIACYFHWRSQILPILKTDALGLSKGVDWMKDFLEYIVAKEIRSVKQIKYTEAVKGICPGQTNQSLARFSSGVAQQWDGKKMIGSKEPLYEICKKKLNGPGNKRNADKNSKYAEEILKIKQTIVTSNYKK